MLTRPKRMGGRCPSRWRIALAQALAVLVSLWAPFASAQADRNMQFQTEADTIENRFSRITMRGGRYDIYATGVIEEDSAKRLQDFVALRKIDRARVYFDSPGGSLGGGLRLGRAIRQLGFETGIRTQNYEFDQRPVATCASACAYAFAGGVSRFYDDTAGRLGLHQFYNAEVNLSSSQTQLMSGVILEFLNSMGVDGRAFAIASVTDKSDMSWLSTSEAEAIGIADNGISPTQAEIRLSQGQSYLRLQQDYNDVTSRVLIYCTPGGVEISGGIVTTPAHSAGLIQYFGISYLEFDQTEYKSVNNSRGSEVSDSTIWIKRSLDQKDVGLLRESDSLGMWLHNGGAMRWGSYINLKQVRSQINSYLDNCRS